MKSRIIKSIKRFILGLPNPTSLQNRYIINQTQPVHKTGILSTKPNQSTKQVYSLPNPASLQNRYIINQTQPVHKTGILSTNIIYNI